MSAKTCKWCGEVKELSEFYVSKTNVDGRMGKCKLCVASRVRENRRERLEQYAQYERSRANLLHRIEARRKYQEEHKEQLSEYKKSWAANNSQRVASRKRRAAMNAGGGHFTVEEFEALCSAYGYACLSCGAADRVLEADHVVPLTRRGSDEISNIQPLCGECNRRKFTAIIDYRPKV